ncbi:MAG: hypothetical protein JWQ14_1374 [Adhaeribacter sp.]|nr:hypothetical protein [Adhaeribacter sp.]
MVPGNKITGIFSPALQVNDPEGTRRFVNHLWCGNY